MCTSPLQIPKKLLHARKSHVHQDPPKSHSYIVSQPGQEVFLLFPIFCALIFSTPICTFRSSTVPFFALSPPSLRGMILSCCYSLWDSSCSGLKSRRRGTMRGCHCARNVIAREGTGLVNSPTCLESRVSDS